MLRFQEVTAERSQRKVKPFGNGKGSECGLKTTHGIVTVVDGRLKFPEPVCFVFKPEDGDKPAHWHSRHKDIDLHLRGDWSVAGLDPSEGEVWLQELTGRVEIKGRRVEWDNEEKVTEYAYLNIFPFDNGTSASEDVILWTESRGKGQSPTDCHTRIGPVAKGANVYLRRINRR